LSRAFSLKIPNFESRVHARAAEDGVAYGTDKEVTTSVVHEEA